MCEGLIPYMHTNLLVPLCKLPVESNIYPLSVTLAATANQKAQVQTDHSGMGLRNGITRMGLQEQVLSLLFSGAPFHLDGTRDACQGQRVHSHFLAHEERRPVINRELSVVDDPVYVRFRERSDLNQDSLLLHINRYYL